MGAVPSSAGCALHCQVSSGTGRDNGGSGMPSEYGVAALPLVFTDLLPLLEAVFANILIPNESRENTFWSPDEELLLVAIGDFGKEQWESSMVLRRSTKALEARYEDVLERNPHLRPRRPKRGESVPPKKPWEMHGLKFDDLALLKKFTQLSRTRQTLHWVTGDPAPLGLGARARQGPQPLQMVVVDPDTPSGEPQSVLAVAAAQVDLAAYLHRHAQAAVVLLETDASWERNFRKGLRRLMNTPRLRPTMFRTPAQVAPGGVVFLAGGQRPGRDLIASLPSSTMVIAAVGADQAAQCEAECPPDRPVERFQVTRLNASRDPTPITWPDIAYLPGTGEVTASSLYAALRFAVTFARHHRAWPDWQDCPELVNWEKWSRFPSTGLDAPYAEVARRVWKDGGWIPLTQRSPLRLRVVREPELQGSSPSAPVSVAQG